MPRPDGWVGSDLRARADVVQWLHDHGDEVHDPTGLIVGRMRRELGKGRAISQLIADMEADGMIEREVSGRRTLRLKLLDDWGLIADLRTKGYEQVYPQSQEDTGSLDLVQAQRQADGLDLASANLEQLADTLLALVVKRAQTEPSKGAELERLREKVTRLEDDLKVAKAQLIDARQNEMEQRRQADSMRDSLAKFQKQVDAKPKRGVALREHLRDTDRKLLDDLMRSLPTSR